MIELKFNLSIQDYQKFIIQARSKCFKDSPNTQKCAKRFGLWGTIILLVVLIVFWALSFEIANIQRYVWAFFAGGLITYICLMYFSKLQLKCIAPGVGGTILGEKLYTFDERGICEKSTNFESTMAWDIVKEITLTKDYIFIYVDNAEAVIIPKRIFKSENGTMGSHLNCSLLEGAAP